MRKCVGNCQWIALKFVIILAKANPIATAANPSRACCCALRANWALTSRKAGWWAIVGGTLTAVTPPGVARFSLIAVTRKR